MRYGFNYEGGMFISYFTMDDYDYSICYAEVISFNGTLEMTQFQDRDRKRMNVYYPELNTLMIGKR